MKEILLNHMEGSLQKSNNLQSKINQDILNLDGMSSAKVRHLLNNLCNSSEFQVNYLEIGTYLGSTISSAIFSNKNLFAIANDNFSEFDGSRARKEVRANIEKFKPNDNIFFVEKPFQELNSNDLQNKKFNIYFFDGNHSYQSQYEALTRMKSSLDKYFILLVDDWEDSTGGPKHGTYDGLRNSNMEIIKQIELPVGTVDGYWGGQLLALIKNN